MLEIFNASIFGFNLIPTFLLGLVLIYWLTVIIGGIEHNILDGQFDFDTDIEADGVGQGIFVFLNLRDVPIMLLISFITIFWWMFATILQLNFNLNVFLSGMVQIPVVIVAVLLTKAITSPFKKFFRELKGTSKQLPLIDRFCKLTTDVAPGKMGLAEIACNGAPIVINVKSIDGSVLHRGDDAIVVQIDKKSGIYEIKQTKDILHVEDEKGGSK